MTADAALLLGCGPVGRAVARLLGNDRAFRRVIVADRCLERAAAATELCNGKADALRLDCADDESLARVLGDVTLVLNTVELPADALLPVIRSVVEAGVSYADANGDPESLQAVFDSEYLASLAGYRGVSVIPGMGASPGQTNALTSYLGQRLNRVDEVRFYQVDDLSLRRPIQWRRRLAAFGSPALVWRDGDWSHISPMSEWEDVAFPPPWGSVRCCAVGLQSVSLPVTMPSLVDVSSHRGFSDAEAEGIMRDLVRYGLAGDQLVETPAGALTPAEFAAAFFSGPWSPLQSSSGQPSRSGLEELPGLPRQMRVCGQLHGRATRFTMTWHFPEERDADNIAAPLAVGARMLLTRELPAPGVHPPETLDPAPFLWDMERRGVEIQLTKTVED